MLLLFVIVVLLCLHAGRSSSSTLLRKESVGEEVGCGRASAKKTSK